MASEASGLRQGEKRREDTLDVGNGPSPSSASLHPHRVITALRGHPQLSWGKNKVQVRGFPPEGWSRGPTQAQGCGRAGNHPPFPAGADFGSALVDSGKRHHLLEPQSPH